MMSDLPYAATDADSGGAHTRERSMRRAAILTALVGAAHAILFLGSYLLLGSIPGAKASTAEIVEFYSSPSRRRVVIVGMYLMPFAGIAFVWFVVSLRVWVEAAAKRVSELMSSVQLVTGIIYIALLFVSAASTTVLTASVEFADGDIDPVVAHQFPAFGNSLSLVFALRMAAMFVISTSTIGRTSGVLPRWFASLGYAVGLFLLLTAALERWFALVFPIWLVVLSVLLLRKALSIAPEVMIATRRPTSMVVISGDGR